MPTAKGIWTFEDADEHKPEFIAGRHNPKLPAADAGASGQPSTLQCRVSVAQRA